jgi:hypothetical protein
MVEALTSRLVLLDVDGAPQRPFRMDRTLLVLGRSDDCDVVLTDPQVSRHHAELRHDHGFWVLRDLGSLEGTTRCDRRLDRPVIMHDGDVIGLGPVHLRFEENAVAPRTTLRPAGAALPGLPVPRRNLESDDLPLPPVGAGGVQEAGVLRERRDLLGEVAATRRRARLLTRLGILLVVAGIGTTLLPVSGFLRDVSAPPDASVILVAVGIEVIGAALVTLGVVLSVVANARRRDVDRRLPDPRIPLPR